MPLKLLKDDVGDSIEVFEVDGFHYTPFPVPNHEDEMRSMPTWKARNDDVLICAYPKSGTHWIWELAYMLVNNKEEITKAIKVIAMMENLNQAKFDAIKSPRVLNSHLLPRHIPQDFFNRRCKLVLIFRNPKDVAVSSYNHHHSLCILYNYHGSWENYLPRFIQGNVDYGSWFDYVADWEKFMGDNPGYPFYVMYYEDMIKDSLGEFTKLARFLEVDRDPKFMEKLNNLCQFDNLKKEKDKLENLEHWRDNKPTMYRKGKVGDWKNWFTVAQNERYDNIIAEKMKTSNIKMQFEI